MGLAILEELLDLNLLAQLVDQIYRLTDKPVVEQRSLFKNLKVETLLEEQYLLKYPGEVLERFEERCGGGIEQERAVLFALAECKDLLGDTMFVGDQLNQFLKKIRSLAVSDFMLCCGLYSFLDPGTEKNSLSWRIHNHDYKMAAEAIIAVYVFQEMENEWDFCNSLLLRFLGTERAFGVYNNEDIYIWVVDQFYSKIKNSRKRNIDLLKCFLDLNSKFVKEGSKSYDRLCNAGYTPQEIFFLNVKIPINSKLVNRLLSNSITTERLVRFGLEQLLNSEHLDNIQLVEFCIELLQRYKEYTIQLEGCRGILVSLKESVVIKNCEMYKGLFAHRKNFDIPEKWFCIDFSNEARLHLIDFMSKSVLIEVFSNSFLNYPDPDIDAWFNGYKKCTGERFVDVFWAQDAYYMQKVFKKLVYARKIDIVELFDQYATDKGTIEKLKVTEKWQKMLNNMVAAVHYLEHYEVFRFWQAFDGKYGICKLGTFLHDNTAVLRSVFTDIGFYTLYNVDVVAHGDILSIEEQKILLSWAEQILYLEMPERYQKFIFVFLRSAQIRKSFPEESYELFQEIIDIIDEQYRDELRRCYYTNEEWQVYQERLKREKEKQREEAQQKRLQDFRIKIEKEIACISDKSRIPALLLEKADAEYFSICYELLDHYLDEMAVDQSFVFQLVNTLAYRYRFYGMPWEELKKCINKVRIIAYEDSTI